MNPAILAENILENGTLTITSEASGYPKENLVSRLPWKKWKGSSSADQTIALELTSGAPATGIAIYQHNLGTIGASVAVQYQGVDTDWYNLDSFSPTDDDIIFRAFDHAGDRTDYRILLTSMSAAPEIGILIFGEYVEFPQAPDVPFVPARRTIQSAGEESNNGWMIGVDVSLYPVTCEAKFRNLTRAWVNGTFLPLYEDYLQKMIPVFYAPDLENLINDIYYVTYNPEQGYSVSLSVLPYVEELMISFRGVI